MISGSLNQNELVALASTEGTAQVGSPTPPVQSCNIVASNAGETCTFTFSFAQLFTDETPGQEYPRGTITWSLTSQPANHTVTGTLVFDKTVIAVLNVDGIGTFHINIETRAVTQQ